MSESDYKKYWYIKLPKEFFNRHDIKILESQQNGKDYALFYLKLLLESITHNGELRFNETIPYNEEMLSVVTNTNVDVVRSALRVLKALKLIELWDDNTLFMTEVNKMIGVETGKAIRMREYHNNKKMLGCSNEPNLSQEIEKEKEKELELEKKENNIKEKAKRFIPPTLEEIKKYIDENHLNVNADKFYNFYESKGWMIGKNKMKDWHRALATWNLNAPKDDTPEWVRDLMKDWEKGW